MPDGGLVWLTINLKNAECDIQFYLDNEKKKIIAYVEAL
jgi:hypothetical protein